MLLGLIRVTEGKIDFQGNPRNISNGKKKKEYWKGIQAIFQDPFASYNMFKRVDSVLLDCINMRGDKNLPKEEKERLMTEACSFVNLKYAELTNKYPFELSGGQTIKEFQQRGNLIVINSGRALPWIVAPLEGYLLPDYMIAGTGSIIADSHQQILHEEPVSFTAIKKIINEYASDIPLTVHTKDNIFSCNQKKQYSLPITPISSIDLLKTEKIYGMSFHFKDNKSAKAFADWLEKSDHQEVRAFVNIQDVDMAWRDCSKGNAMNILCQKLGFMHEQVYAIGDAENDIDMLRATKHGYTFHHSPATVKQYAEGCVKSVSELIDKILKIS